MSFSSFGWGATSSQKSWFDYSPRHQNSLTNFLLKKREDWGNYFMKNIVPFITSIYYPIWLWPKNLVLGGFPETSQLVDYLVRIAFKSKGKDSNDLIRVMDGLFLSIFAILFSPSLYLFFRPFWEILSRKLDDDDVMLSWKLVRKSEIRFPMPFLRLYIDQIFSACLTPLCFQDDATFLLHTFSDFFDQERKMKRNWAYNLTHLTISFEICTY